MVFPRYIDSPFYTTTLIERYFDVTDAKKPFVAKGYTNPIPRLFFITFARDPSLDSVIHEINTIIAKGNEITDLEARILNAIEIFGMIDDSTPLHVRFMLCILSLEGLLLSKRDKDYLRWKLSEKIAFLIGDSKEWFIRFYKLEDADESVLTKQYALKGLSEARIALTKKVQELYDKRSGFTHRGISKKKEENEIVYDDYEQIWFILRSCISGLLQLQRSGIISSIAKN